MTDIRRASLLAAVLVSIALTVVACGGASATPTPVPVGEATTPPAATTPTPEPTPGAEATPEVAIPTIDWSGLTANLEGVDSYRIQVSAGGQSQYQAVVIKGPVHAEAVTLGSGNDVTRLLVIGDEAWMAAGAEKYQSVPAATVTGMVGAFSPALLVGAFASAGTGGFGSAVGTEQKNGVNTTHYRLDTSSPIAILASMPPGAAVDVWVADQGYLVSFVLSGMTEAAANVSIDVTNVNDPANKVDRPS
jgi:hypothetical protein